MAITDELRKYISGMVTRGIAPICKETLAAIADSIDAEHEKAEYEWKAKDGQTWLRGYGKCHAELMEGNKAIAADLERAGWVRLPVDADGEVIHIGDVMRDRSFPDAKYTVVGIGEDEFFTRDVYGELYEHTASLYIHYKQSTVEDVLHSFICDVEEDVRDEREIIAEYAAKLRLADDGKEQ